MSVEEVQRMELEAKDSAELRAKLQEAGAEPAKLAEVASSLGYDVSEDDINQYIEAKRKALSEEDLDKIAGGGTTTETQTVGDAYTGVDVAVAGEEVVGVT